MLATVASGEMVSTAVAVGDTFEMLGNDAHLLTVSKVTPCSCVVECPQCGWCEVFLSRMDDLLRDGWLKRTNGVAAGVVPVRRVSRRSCLGNAVKEYRARGGRSCSTADAFM